MSYRKIVIFLIGAIFCLYGCADADPEIKAPNGKVLYEKTLSKVKTIYFFYSQISKIDSLILSTKDKDDFIKILKEVKKASWNDIDVRSGTFEYTFLITVENAHQYHIRGNANGEMVFSYNLIYPGIIDKWMKEKNMSYLNRYMTIKYLVNKEKLESLVKPYKEKLMKKK